MNFLETIDTIGRTIEENSPKKGDFSALAFSELKKYSLPSLFHEKLLPDLRQRHEDMEPLKGRSCNFSDECFILYLGQGFSIEMYHWDYRDTAIHDHDFQGVFQCLKGLNHQLQFEYITGSQLFPGMEKGELKPLGKRKVSPGEIETIRDEDHFIHVVSHETSTFNLCIRTNTDGSKPLRVYHVDGLRYVVPVSNERLEELENDKDYPISDFSSEELLFAFHNHPFSQKKRAGTLLSERHGIDFLKSQQETWNFLNQLSETAKGI